MANKKVLVGEMSSEGIPSGQGWAASDTLQDPDGNTIYHTNNPPPINPPLSNTTPLVESGSGTAGSSSSCSRADHVHPAASSAPPVSGLSGTLIASGSVAAVGSGFTSVLISSYAGTSPTPRFHWAGICMGNQVSGGYGPTNAYRFACKSYNTGSGSTNVWYLILDYYNIGVYNSTPSVSYKVYLINET